jgi:excisionase family DNA binding protein
MYTKVTEIAERFRVSKDAVYLWVRKGIIPSWCVDRAGSTIRIRSAEFERLLREGKLFRPRRSVNRQPGEPRTPIAEDSVTTCREGLRYEHRWINESGSVIQMHPYGPADLEDARKHGRNWSQPGANQPEIQRKAEEVVSLER